VKGVSFIPLLVKLAIEFGCFDKELRGGLLVNEDIDGNNVIQRLMFDSTPEIFDSEHNVLVDDRYIRVIIQLRELGLFTREDIYNFNLIIELCKKKYYAEKRFHFLPQFNTYALTRPDSYGRLYLFIMLLLILLRRFKNFR
jgi:hypothetical protein